MKNTSTANKTRRGLSIVCIAVFTFVALLSHQLAPVEAQAPEQEVQQTPIGGDSPSGWWALISAWDIKLHHWSGPEPHYAAYFSQSAQSCHSPQFWGPSDTCTSSGGCISNWNWVGDHGYPGSPATRLLLPKVGWYWDPGKPDAKNHAHYHATCYLN